MGGAGFSPRADETKGFLMSDMVHEKTNTTAFVVNTLFESFYKVFKVNINSGAFEVFKNDGLLSVPELDNAPDIYTYMSRLISEKVVYPEYATACRRFTNPEYVRKSVFSGNRRLVQSYRRRTNAGDKWITFAIISPENCTPENPEVLFTWREADADAITMLDTLPTVSSLYDKLIRINLSNNTFEPVIVDADEQERLVGGVINMYEWWAGYSQNGNIAAEDMGAFSTLTRAGSLQERFAQDPTPVSFRYRRKVNDEFRWVQLEIAPSVEYSEKNQIMLLSLKDIHEEYTAQMRSRQELIDNMNHDALTNLSNRLKFNEDIEALTKADGPIFTCLYIDVNGLHELNNLLGHQKGDDMLCCVAETLRERFPEENIYRIGGDEFVVTSTTLLKHSVDVIIDRVRSDLRAHNYEISVGIESGSCGAAVEKTVAAAELEMRNDKEAYYLRNGDRRRKREMNAQLEQMLVDKRYGDCFLSAIANQFSSVFFVNPANDTMRHIYISDPFANLLEESGAHFTAAVRLYVEQYVEPEYAHLFEDVLDYKKLDAKLHAQEAVEFSYRKKDGVRMNARILQVDKHQNAKQETIWIFAEEK